MHKIVGKLIQHNLVLLYFIDTILYIIYYDENFDGSLPIWYLSYLANYRL